MTQPAAESHPAEPAVIGHAASELPVRRGDRLAFQIWTLMFLGVIAFTLVQYVINWML